MRIEPWARDVVAEELGETVSIHDDQSQPSMYDLRVGPKTAPLIAIECVQAIDEERAATWNVGPRRGSLTLPVNGNWGVGITKNAIITKLKVALPSVLRSLESAGLWELRADPLLKRDEPGLFRLLTDLGVRWLSCYDHGGNGRVFFSMEGVGGAVDSLGALLPSWIDLFLRHPTHDDVLCKLSSSGAPERHVFIAVHLGGAPFAVESYLSRCHVLPSQPPDLPPPVTGVWVVGGQLAAGVRWTGSAWKLFTFTFGS